MRRHLETRIASTRSIDGDSPRHGTNPSQEPIGINVCRRFELGDSGHWLPPHASLFNKRLPAQRRADSDCLKSRNGWRLRWSKGLGSSVVRLKIHDGQLRMVAWYRDPKPDKGKKWVREPIEPAEALRATPVGNVEIKPNEEELVWTEAGYKVGSEA